MSRDISDLSDKKGVLLIPDEVSDYTRKIVFNELNKAGIEYHAIYAIGSKRHFKFHYRE